MKSSTASLHTRLTELRKKPRAFHFSKNPLINRLVARPAIQAPALPQTRFAAPLQRTGAVPSTGPAPPPLRRRRVYLAAGALPLRHDPTARHRGAGPLSPGKLGLPPGLTWARVAGDKAAPTKGAESERAGGGARRVAGPAAGAGGGTALIWRCAGRGVARPVGGGGRPLPAGSRALLRPRRSWRRRIVREWGECRSPGRGGAAR